MFITSFFILLFFLFSWFSVIINESTFEGHHTSNVREGIRLGMCLFIASEVMFVRIRKSCFLGCEALKISNMDSLLTKIVKEAIRELSIKDPRNKFLGIKVNSSGFMKYNKVLAIGARVQNIPELKESLPYVSEGCENSYMLPINYVYDKKRGTNWSVKGKRTTILTNRLIGYSLINSAYGVRSFCNLRNLGHMASRSHNIFVKITIKRTKTQSLIGLNYCRKYSTDQLTQEMSGVT